jgi:sugar-specific transcriptional regulator TrmB
MIGGSDLAKLVYLYLEQVGDASVGELRDVLGVSFLRLYPVLSSLEERGFIEYVSGERVCLVSRP